MANNQAPFGFQFTRNLYSAAPNYTTSIYQIASNNANSFGKGDVVKGLTSGYVDRSLTTDTTFLGVLDRIEYYDTAQNKKIFTNAWTAPSTALAGTVIAYVIDDLNAVFGCQAGGSTTAIGIADTFANINFAANAAPNTAGISVAYANQTTINTTATLPFRIVNVPQTLGNTPMTAAPINNDSTSAYNYVEVIGNAWQVKNTTGV